MIKKEEDFQNAKLINMQIVKSEFYHTSNDASLAFLGTQFARILGKQKHVHCEIVW